jgi:hypothetical protein
MEKTLHTHEYFLQTLVDDGIAAVTRNYADCPHKLEGSIAGFEACRGKSPGQPRELLTDCEAMDERLMKTALKDADLARDRLHDFWRLRCLIQEVRYLCNVVSAALVEYGYKPV